MEKNIIKGLIAGAIGGLVATKIKSVIEDSYPVRSESTDSPPVVLAERLLTHNNGEQLSPLSKKKAETKIHWTFGIATGALYGMSVEKNSKNKKGLGALMGTTLYSATHGSVLPLLKTEPWPTENKKSYVANEFISHIAFGVTTEIVRRITRKLL